MQYRPSDHQLDERSHQESCDDLLNRDMHHVIEREDPDRMDDDLPYFFTRHAEYGLAPITSQSLIQAITILEAMGYHVGLRDPKINTRETGAFMICDRYEDGHTQEASTLDVWAMVGDDMPALIDAALAYLNIDIDKDED